jgi:hypothetical protein
VRPWGFHWCLIGRGNIQRRRGHWLNREGAIALAKRLQQYWHDQGYPAARFWAEPLDERFTKIGTYEVYQVKCNLVNGLPPRYRGERN